MNRTEWLDAVNAVANREYSRYEPEARKSGRNPKWPYVPIVKVTDRESGRESTKQLLGLAYATREEAEMRAVRQILAWQDKMVADLMQPNKRAYREFLGLPRELVIEDEGETP